MKRVFAAGLFVGLVLMSLPAVLREPSLASWLVLLWFAGWGAVAIHDAILGPKAKVH